MNISVLILAAGQAGFETHDGGYPLCLTEFDGLSLLERIVRNTSNIKGAKYAFALLIKETERFHLDKVAKLLAPSAVVIRTPESTQGSACTALLAASQLDPESELLIISANELVDVDFSEVVTDFRCRKLDGGLLVFRSVHPRYSYVRLNAERLVTMAAQQDPISHHATAGVFWFAKTREFTEAAMNLIRKNASVNGKFYVAPVFNELILRHGRIGVRDLEISKYSPLKTERQVQQFEHGSPV
jgi:hypothetical protein